MASLDVRHFCLLAALQQHGSLHAAARALHLSPSALSQQLRELEQRLGGSLFRREWRRLAPTPAGLRLLQGAHTVLEEIERVENEARSLIRGATGTLRFAMACQQSYRWLPAVLSRFADLEPGIEVTIVGEAATAPTEWLLSRKLDVALLAGKPPRDRRLKCTPLFRDELVAIVSRRHPWARQRRVEVAAFADEQLFCDEHALETREPLGHALAKAGVAPKKRSLVPMHGTVALDLVHANLGVTVMPRWTAAPFTPRKDYALLPIGACGLWLDWFVVTRQEIADKALSTFLGVLLEQQGAARREAAKHGNFRRPRDGLQ
jgi:LysR family transcriptional regulator for metE and metH